MRQNPSKAELLELLNNAKALNEELLIQVKRLEQLIYITEDDVSVNKMCVDAASIIDKYHYNEGYIKYLKQLLEQIK